MKNQNSNEIKYPPSDILKKLRPPRINIIFLILWMLYNNEIVTWYDLKQEPLRIPQSTLANYLKQLQDEGYVEKIERGQYKITKKGEKKFNQLEKAKYKRRSLVTPPTSLTKSLHYANIILWTTYNNRSVTWKDFIQKDSPLWINQPDLSQSMKFLLQEGYVIKNENREYRITEKGKSQYKKIVKMYNV